MNSVIETLGSQAYGAGNKELCGVYLNRGRFMQCCLFVPIVLLMPNVHLLYAKLG